MPRNITVTFEDGTSHVYSNAPDDVTPEQVQARAAKEFGKGVTGLDGGRKPADTPSGGFLGGVRDLAAGAVRGAGSIGATLLTPYDMLAGNTKSIGNPERRAAMDEALANPDLPLLGGADTNSLAYQGGKIGGEIAGTLGAGPALAGGARAVPMLARAAPNVIKAIETGGMTAGAGGLGARTAGGAIAGGGSAALVDPETAGMGAAVGGALPGGMKLAGVLGNTIGGALRPNINNPALAAKAINQYGIPLGAADISKSRVTKAARSVLNDAPLLGGIGEAQREATQEGFNRAVGGTFGAAEAKLTPEVMDAAKKRMGAEFDRIWGGNALQVDGQMVQKLSQLETLAQKLPRNEGGSLSAEIQDLLSKVQPGANGVPTIPGEAANRFQSYLRRRAEGSPGLRNELGDLRQTIIDALNRGVSPQDAAALTVNRGQYRAMKTVEPILRKAEAGVAGREVGDVAPGLLPGAAAQSYRNGLSGTPFEDLSQIGSQYLTDRVARTGGSIRAGLQNAALGAGLVTMSTPAALASVPAAALAQYAMGSPAVARLVLKAQGGNQNAIAALLADPRLAQLAYRAAPVAATSSVR